VFVLVERFRGVLLFGKTFFVSLDSEGASFCRRGGLAQGFVAKKKVANQLLEFEPLRLRHIYFH
jgi:hypothetical protein